MLIKGCTHGMPDHLLCQTEVLAQADIKCIPVYHTSTQKHDSRQNVCSSSFHVVFCCQRLGVDIRPLQDISFNLDPSATSSICILLQHACLSGNVQFGPLSTCVGDCRMSLGLFREGQLATRIAKSFCPLCLTHQQPAPRQVASVVFCLLD